MIDPLNNFINKKGIKKDKEENKKVNIKKDITSKKSIEDNIIESFNKEIDEIIQEINNLEKELLKNPSEENIDKYRKVIKQFLSKVNENYKSFVYKRWKGGQVKIWQTINKQVDAIYREVISSQVKAFDILEKLSSLKGLIIDLKIEGV